MGGASPPRARGGECSSPPPTAGGQGGRLEGASLPPYTIPTGIVIGGGSFAPPPIHTPYGSVIPPPHSVRGGGAGLPPPVVDGGEGGSSALRARGE
ncbi:hypothetical protein G9A89_000316 [Geosiphon pyriformis]|nr:hypothetical protein G9A89_000316 [Geosiphon pyriformis]